MWHLLFLATGGAFLICLSRPDIGFSRPGSIFAGALPLPGHCSVGQSGHGPPLGHGPLAGRRFPGMEKPVLSCLPPAACWRWPHSKPRPETRFGLPDGDNRLKTGGFTSEYRHMPAVHFFVRFDFEFPISGWTLIWQPICAHIQIHFSHGGPDGSRSNRAEAATQHGIGYLSLVEEEIAFRSQSLSKMPEHNVGPGLLVGHPILKRDK